MCRVRELVEVTLALSVAFLALYGAWKMGLEK